MDKEYDWFYAQVGTQLEGLWVAIEEASGMPGPRVIDSDESLVALVLRLDRRLHQGVLVGRVPRKRRGDSLLWNTKPSNPDVTREFVGEVDGWGHDLGGEA